MPVSRMAVLATLALAGCAAPAPDPERYAEYRRVLNERPTLRPVAVAGCIEKQAAKSPSELVPVASLLQVDATEVPGLVCPHIVEALANGTIGPQELLDIQLGRLDPALVRQVMPVPRPAV